MSCLEVSANRLDTLASLSFTAFPQPALAWSRPRRRLWRPCAEAKRRLAAAGRLAGAGSRPGRATTPAIAPSHQYVGSTRNHVGVPLTLVTGPANAEKARVVLDGYRAGLQRGDEPILVVPTLADVERYRAELAASGIVFGAQVLRFGRLIDEAARRGGVRGRPLGRIARERLASAAVAATPLRALRGSAATAGFARELLRFVDEIEELRVTPQRLTQALRAWAGEDGGRRAYADEVAALYADYRRLLDRLKRRDAPLFGAAALDALRENSAAWGATPVFFYGFDDLTPLQRDAVQTLSNGAAAVTLSLAYEPGRMAFAGRATTFAELIGEDVKQRALKPRAEHYAPAAREALHHLERGLFEDGDAVLFDPAPIDPGDAITLLQGGGERAELELVAADRGRPPQPGRCRASAGRGVRRVRRAGRTAAAGRVRAHAARPRPRRAAALRADGGYGGGSAGIPADARPAQASAARRRARGTRAPGGRAERR
jgi:hypothetical protein